MGALVLRPIQLPIIAQNGQARALLFLSVVNPHNYRLQQLFLMTVLFLNLLVVEVTSGQDNNIRIIRVPPLRKQVRNIGTPLALIVALRSLLQKICYRSVNLFAKIMVVYSQAQQCKAVRNIVFPVLAIFAKVPMLPFLWRGKNKTVVIRVGNLCLVIFVLILCKVE